MKKLLLFLTILCGAMFTMAQTTFNWVHQSISPENNLFSIIMVEDTLVVVGAKNTFFKSIDKGSNWDIVKAVDPDYDFISMSINSNGIGLLSTRRSKMIDYSGLTDPAVNGKILKTADNGSTWTIMDLSGISNTDPTVDPNKEGSYAYDIYAVDCVDANNAFAYIGWYDIISGSQVTCGAVFETTDGGTTWSPITEDLGNDIITAIQTKGTTTYVAGANTFFKKSGETITDLYPTLVTADGGTDETIYIFDIDVISETEFYVVTTANGLFHSTDGGTTITEMTGTGIPAGGNDLKVIDANTIMVLGTATRSKVTVDGGANWTNCYPGVSCWEIEGVFKDSVYALAKQNVYKIAVSDLSTNPTNWVAQSVTNIDENLQQMYIVDANTAIIAGNSEILRITSDGGKTWSDITHPKLYDQSAEEQEYEVDFNGICYSDSVSYATARRFDLESYSSFNTYFPGPIFKSTDNWKTWELLDINEIGAENTDDPSIYPFHDNCYGFDPYAIECITDSIVYVWANWYDTTISYADKVNYSRVFRSTDGGESWNYVTDDLGGSFVKEIYFKDKDNGYIVGSHTLLKTTDGGETFTDLYPTLDPSDEYNMYFRSIYEIGDEIYLPTTNDSVWVTNDGGTSFTALNYLIGTTDIYKFNDTTLIALGTADKSFLTTDGEDNWEVCSPGTSVLSIGGIVNDSLLVLAKGDICRLAVSEIVIEDTPDYIDEIKHNDIIKILNHSTELELVSTGEKIDVCTVYNILGQIIEIQNPNSNSCTINKSEYEPGIYIISTSINNKRYTHKIMF